MKKMTFYSVIINLFMVKLALNTFSGLLYCTRHFSVFLPALTLKTGPLLFYCIIIVNTHFTFYKSAATSANKDTESAMTESDKPPASGGDITAVYLLV